jgi:phosphatidylserine/phosphatidylglycerophosphate/cardiolipin synthase-like enzyme
LGIDSGRARKIKEALRARDRRTNPEVIELLQLSRRCVSLAMARHPDIEIAVTHPGPEMPPMRSTAAITPQIVDRARRSVLIVGYSVTVDSGLLGLPARTLATMGRAAARGVLVTAILHRDPKNRDALLAGWPHGVTAPNIFTWPERPGDAMAALHAKVIVADASEALVTSANLTYHGYEANIEVGVRITGSAAAQLESVFRELIRTRDFVPWKTSSV